MNYLSNFCLASLIINCAVGQLLYEDDPCRTNQGARGVCKVDCPEAVNIQKTTGVRATLCGFAGSSPIVCCPESSSGANTNSNNNWQNVNFNPRPTNTRPTTGTRPRPSTSNRPLSNTGNRGTSRISDEMCKKYSKPVTQTFQAQFLLTDPDPFSITVPKCTHNSSPLIVGGEEAQTGEFPHMAAIGYNDPGKPTIFNCGGTLISERFVVTAAHCASTRDYGPPVVVRLGEHDLESDDDGMNPQDVPIANITVRQEYRYPSKYYDIALIRLVRDVVFSETIRPACLWQRETIDHSSAVAIGWGKLAYGPTAPKSSALQKVVLNLINQDRCSRLAALAPRPRGAIPRGLIREQLCAGDLEKGGVDTCQGDSGGPLQVTNPGNRCIFYLVGITSYGIGCGDIESPGVYTRVSSFLDWIEEKVWPQ